MIEEAVAKKLVERIKALEKEKLISDARTKQLQQNYHLLEAELNITKRHLETTLKETDLWQNKAENLMDKLWERTSR